MSFSSYARDRLDSGSAILEWDADGHRYWAFTYDDQRYLVKARVVRDEVVDVHLPRRLGEPQLQSVLREQWIEVRAPGDDEVPDPITLIAREGPSVVEDAD
jgi:hypothetical protein